jgi:hypothetical protein
VADDNGIMRISQTVLPNNIIRNKFNDDGIGAALYLSRMATRKVQKLTT